MKSAAGSFITELRKYQNLPVRDTAVQFTSCTRVFREGLTEKVMHKLSLEGGVGLPQIFKVGTEFERRSTMFRECYCQIINPGGCHHPMLQAGEGQSRKEPDEEDKRERESLSQGSC